MLFQRKYDKAMELLKEKNKEYEEEERNKANQNQEDEDLMLDKKDRLAMTMSAFLVFIPAAILVLGVFALIAFLFGLL